MKKAFYFLACCVLAASVTRSAVAQTPAPAAGTTTTTTTTTSTTTTTASACGDFLTPVAAPADAPAQWTAFMTAVAAINDYSLMLHEVDNTDDAKPASEDRMLKLSFAKPCYGRVEVLKGRLEGSAAVWHGGHKLKGHQGGSLSHLKGIIPDTDERATDVRGLPMYAVYFPWIINRFNEQGPGSITYAPGPTVNGAPTDAITVVEKVPGQNYGLTKDTLILSSTTHLPVANDGYHNDKLVLHAEFQDVVLNPGLPITTFDL